MIPLPGLAQEVLSPEDSLLIGRAEQAIESREYSRAIALYRQVLSRNPTSYGARYGIARSFLRQGEPDRTAPYLNALVKDFPSEADPRVLRGFTDLGRGRFASAEQ